MNPNEYTVAEAPPSVKKAGPPVKESIRETYVNRYGRLEADGFRFNVKIKDVRNRYGNLDVLVTPMAGDGEKWVSVHRIDHVWD